MMVANNMNLCQICVAYDLEVNCLLLLGSHVKDKQLFYAFFNLLGCKGLLNGVEGWFPSWREEASPFGSFLMPVQIVVGRSHVVKPKDKYARDPVRVLSDTIKRHLIAKVLCCEVSSTVWCRAIPRGVGWCHQCQLGGCEPYFCEVELLGWEIGFLPVAHLCKSFSICGLHLCNWWMRVR